MGLYRITALALSSILFFPVSCSTGLIAGTNIIAMMEARDSLRGDKPHQEVYLVALVPGTPQKTEAFPLYELDEFKRHNPQASFLLPTESGEFAIGTHGATISFVAATSKQKTQIVEVTLHDNTGTFFRYEATDRTINPMYTKLRYHGYMFGAVPYALAFAVGLFFIGKKMRRRANNEST